MHHRMKSDAASAIWAAYWFSSQASDINHTRARAHTVIKRKQTMNIIHKLMLMHPTADILRARISSLAVHQHTCSHQHTCGVIDSLCMHYMSMFII